MMTSYQRLKEKNKELEKQVSILKDDVWHLVHRPKSLKANMIYCRESYRQALERVIILGDSKHYAEASNEVDTKSGLVVKIKHNNKVDRIYNKIIKLFRNRYE